MAEKLIRRHSTQDDTLYALFFRATDGKVWDVANNTWATFTDANIADYDVAGVELGTYSLIYTFDVPTHANFGSGRFTAILFDQAGGSPAVGDPLITGGLYPSSDAEIDFHYDGAKIVDFVTYFARVDLTLDADNTRDEWTVRWYRNGTLVGPDAATTPQIQVIKRADGTDLIAAANLTQVGSSQIWKKDEATNRVTKGEAVIVVVTQTINGVVRTWSELRSRDK